MDPATAFAALSLACSVAQLVEQGITVTRFCRTLYEKGSLDENDLIETYAKEITAANKEIEVALKEQPPAPRTTRLQSTAQDVLATADKLRIELNKLKFSKTQGKSIASVGRAFRSALRNLSNSGKIKDIQTTLEKQEKALQSGLLNDL